MENVISWIKGIVVLFVLLAAFLYLVPNKQYKKYIQFFMEMIIVIAVITPISKVVYANQDFEEMIHYTQFWQEMENAQKDAGKMSFLKTDYYKKEYEQAIGEDMTQMAQDKGFAVKNIQVSLTSNYELEKVSMNICKKEDEKQVSIEPVIVKGSLIANTKNASVYHDLQEKIKEFYHLKDDQIAITYVGE
jgi:stage III sporulation protein AF